MSFKVRYAASRRSFFFAKTEVKVSTIAVAPHTIGDAPAATTVHAGA
ncbi:hypothetical protein [Nocardia abscessus]|nr:hypothetical protein [Nocardia abscessus]MCC3328219.1 hypothetical protein [Nocardia abscessus]